MAVQEGGYRRKREGRPAQNCKGIWRHRAAGPAGRHNEPVGNPGEEQAAGRRGRRRRERPARRRAWRQARRRQRGATTVGVRRHGRTGRWTRSWCRHDQQKSRTVQRRRQHVGRKRGAVVRPQPAHSPSVRVARRWNASSAVEVHHDECRRPGGRWARARKSAGEGQRGNRRQYKGGVQMSLAGAKRHGTMGQVGGGGGGGGSSSRSRRKWPAGRRGMSKSGASPRRRRGGGGAGAARGRRRRRQENGTARTMRKEPSTVMRWWNRWNHEPGGDHGKTRGGGMSAAGPGGGKRRTCCGGTMARTAVVAPPCGVVVVQRAAGGAAGVVVGQAGGGGQRGGGGGGKNAGEKA